MNVFLLHLRRFGIAVNSDSVVRTVFYKYLHPKVWTNQQQEQWQLLCFVECLPPSPRLVLQEVLISNGILNKEIAEAGKKLLARGKDRSSTTGTLVPATRALSEAANSHR